ncbi:MAG: KTSC domain-containing protein [Gammaproteobacteria bacterium]
MIVTAVESATLRTIAYDESLTLLRLEFRSLALYDYFGVPPVVHEQLLHAPSIGACFNAIVRGCFPYRRVSPIDAESLPKGDR